MTKRYQRPIALVIIAGAVLAALALTIPKGRSSAGPVTRLVITGSSTIAPLAVEVAQRFEQLHPDIRIDVQTGGSSRGIADTRRGLNDLGMVSRALTKNEADLLKFTIAQDTVGLIVHEHNPLGGISRERLAAIYRGEIQDWAEVGGNAGPITLIHKAEGRATLDVFLAYFRLDNRDINPDVVVGDNEQAIKTVAANPSAIGYVSISTAEVAIREGTPIRLLPLGSIRHGDQSNAIQPLAMSRPLNFVSLDAPTGLTREFLNYATSEAVHDLITRSGFAPPGD